MVDWDARYAAADCDGLFGAEPNAYVRQIITHPGFPKGTALCLADGDGRNSRWLAAHGYDVTAVDLSAVATERAQELDDMCGIAIDRITADLADWGAGPGQAWDVALLIYLQCERAVRLKAIRTAWQALRPGGWFVLEGFASPSAGSGATTGRLGPRDSALLYSMDELYRSCPDALIVEALEGTVHLDEGGRHQGLAHVIRLCARKPAAVTEAA